MLQKTICLVAMLAAFAANIAFSQKNSIRLQTGLFHYFFDKSPILNVNYRAKEFNSGLLINSVGISYSRKIKEKNRIECDVAYFYESYRKYFNMYPIEKPVIGIREFLTFSINYSRQSYNKGKFNLIYGGGINYRYGHESIIVNRFPMVVTEDYILYEVSIEGVSRSDLGLNIFSGMEYSPKKWLTLYSKIDLLSFVYINDKAMTKELKEVYDSPQYPTRFDLSLKFGIGFNF